MDPLLLKRILEAVLLAAAQPLSLSQLAGLFTEEEAVDNDQISAALAALAEDCAERGIELKEVASGFRYQIREDVHGWVTRLWTERQTKYSRALLETLALIAYRQPITRAEIEQIRGVAVSSSIIKTLEEREWVRVVGYRDVPGRPALFGTSRSFLDYFNLKSLDELPPLAEIRDLDDYDPQLDLAPVIPPSLELPPEDQEAMAAEAAAEVAAAGGEAGTDAAVTDAADADHAAAEAGASDEAVAADAEVPADVADADESAAAAAALDEAADDDEAAAETPVIAETTEEAEEAARLGEATAEAEASDASRDSEEPGSEELGTEEPGSEQSDSAESIPDEAESGSTGSDDSTDTTASGSHAAAIEAEESAADTRGPRKPSPAPSAQVPDDAGDDYAADFADAPEADDDWSTARESALDSDDTPDFADSDFSPDDEDVDPPETTTSDDVPEHNA